MSYESTQKISRKQAEEMYTEVISKKIAKLYMLTDVELEDELYSLTRDTHYFDNFRITHEEL